VLSLIVCVFSVPFSWQSHLARFGQSLYQNCSVCPNQANFNQKKDFFSIEKLKNCPRIEHTWTFGSKFEVKKCFVSSKIFYFQFSICKQGCLQHCSSFLCPQFHRKLIISSWQNDLRVMTIFVSSMLLLCLFGLEQTPGSLVFIAWNCFVMI